jgi:NADPH:quinone reductase-like Zn-dependent oxidoreductase
MKAVMLERYGQDLETLVVRDVPEPPMGPHDVRVEVHAAGFNPFEAKLRKGYLQRFYPFALPHVLGNDFAGIITAKGPAVWGLEVGDRVYGMQDTMRWGSYAETVAVNATNVRRMPKNLSFVEAASLPMVYETAWVGLVDLALLRPGELVLVQGAAGGVGSATLQLARVLGAHVAATCSTDAVEWVRAIGASIIIDRRKQEFARLLANVDVVFDPIGGQTNLDSYRVMRRGGRMVVVLREDQLELAHGARLCAEHEVTRHEVVFEQRGDVLDHIRPMFESGRLKPVVTRTLPLEEAREAHRASDEGGARGKVVLKVR